MFKIKRAISLLMVCLLVLLSAGCSNSGSAPKGGSDTKKEPIKLGMVLSITGGSAGYGIHMRNGAQMAVDEINEKGGVSGRKIELYVEDDASDPSKATTALNRLITQYNVDAVVGGTNSTICFAVKDIAEQQGIPFITTSGSNPKLTGPDNKFFFRLHQSDSIVAGQCAALMVDLLKAKKIAILHDTADYGMGNRDYFTKYLKEKYNMEAVITEVYNVGDQDFTPQLVKIKEKNPDAIALFGNIPEVCIATKQIRQLGMKNMPIGMTGISNPKYIELAPGDSEGVFAITPFNPGLPDPEVKAFAEKYTKLFNMDAPHHGSNTYQAVNALKMAWEKVGTDSKEKVADQLKKIEWKIFGSTNKFDANGQVQMKSVIVQVQNGKWAVYKDQLK